MGSTMKKPIVSIIAAVGKKTLAIGAKNGLIWKIEGDLPRFKRLTMGHPIIMGRNTFTSLGRGPLPGRTNIVVSRNQEEIPGATVVNSIEQAIEKARVSEGSEEIFIIGGGEIYRQTISLADKLYLTIVESDEPGDIFFPDYSAFTKVMLREPHLEHNPPFTYLELIR